MKPSRVAAFAVLVAVTILFTARPSLAHDDKGTIAVGAAQPTGPLTIRYDLMVTFNNDGHGAPEATVTAVAESTGQPVVGPVAATPGPTDGAYVVELTFPSPGDWTVRFSSLTPIAVTERPETVAAPEVTTTVLLTTPAPGPTAAASSTTPPTDPTTATVTVPATPVPSGTRDSGVGSEVFIVVLLALAGVAAVAVFQARRSRSSREG